MQHQGAPIYAPRFLVSTGLILCIVSACYLGAVLVPLAPGGVCQPWGETGLCVSLQTFQCGGWGGWNPWEPPHQAVPPLTCWPLLLQYLRMLSGGCASAISTWGCLLILGRNGPLCLTADFPVWVGGEDGIRGSHPIRLSPLSRAGPSSHNISA